MSGVVKLWEATLQLLRLYKSDNSDHILLSGLGNPLKKSILNSAGKFCKNDSIGLAFRRMVAKNNLPDKSFKALRKTAASTLAQHEHYGRFTKVFLGHSLRSVEEKHYTRYPQDLFDKAVVWLGEQFGLK